MEPASSLWDDGARLNVKKWVCDTLLRAGQYARNIVGYHALAYHN